jgi:hypothetical protein
MALIIFILVIYDANLKQFINNFIDLLDTYLR